MDNLKTALRTQTLSFVVCFIESRGLQQLLDFLTQMDDVISEGPVHTAVIGCIKALLNIPVSRTALYTSVVCVLNSLFNSSH